MEVDFQALKKSLNGDLYTDSATRLLYATDASAYREMPMAVACPKDKNDIQHLLTFARENHLSIIPRAAGTSLAGQVVGKGIVVDISRHFTSILQLNIDEKWVKVQPGVIRDELNAFLKPHKLLFGPETSTSNRAMIGGMIGNNSCGTHSVIFGSTRDHLISVDAILADGTEVTFGPLSNTELHKKLKGGNVKSPLEQKIYEHIFNLVGAEENQEIIKKNYPKIEVTRRNTGYSLDMLMQCQPFNTTKNAALFNLCRLIAGSEGTLAFITSAKLNLVDALPEHNAVMCIHFLSVQDALKANIIAMKLKPAASELLDHYVLEAAQRNTLQRQNASFVKGKPEAILVVEFFSKTESDLDKKLNQLENSLKAAKLGDYFPILKNEEVNKVWDLRKAGLGLLSNVSGDAKPAGFIEDTAVSIEDLPDYIHEFNEILKKYDLHCVHYAHAGSGELHLRPILNLKTEEGKELFHTILEEIAKLVKKYRGSLSGEHGDGRLRGEFIPFMYGETIYKWFEEIKRVWDEKHILNPGKITNTPVMNESLRYKPNQKTPQFDTIFSFEKEGGILRAAENCNGTGVCRRTHILGGTMCPSYMATHNEKDTTRARANTLRETLTHNKKPFRNKDLMQSLDLCLSCKACKSECPSNVDMAKMKAEVYYQHYKHRFPPLRSVVFANIFTINSAFSKIPVSYNYFSKRKWMRKMLGIAVKRSMPPLSKQPFEKWYRNHQTEVKNPIKEVYLFVDEFSAYLDVEVAKAAVRLLTKLNYKVNILPVLDSGRAAISKGFLGLAKKKAEKVIRQYKGKITKETPLVGLEPSAILTLVDEYPNLVDKSLREDAEKMKENICLFDEFIAEEADKGNIKSEQFTDEAKTINMQGHCHQKSLRSMVSQKKALSLPKNYTVINIPSGCCGMAGSFGYEKEHYEISMQIGELVLFPFLRNKDKEQIISASGTSCRHQINDGTGKIALHPAQILLNALK